MTIRPDDHAGTGDGDGDDDDGDGDGDGGGDDGDVTPLSPAALHDGSVVSVTTVTEGEQPTQGSSPSDRITFKLPTSQGVSTVVGQVTNTTHVSSSGGSSSGAYTIQGHVLSATPSFPGADAADFFLYVDPGLKVTATRPALSPDTCQRKH